MSSSQWKLASVSYLFTIGRSYKADSILIIAFGVVMTRCVAFDMLMTLCYGNDADRISILGLVLKKK